MTPRNHRPLVVADFEASRKYLNIFVLDEAIELKLVEKRDLAPARTPAKLIGTAEYHTAEMR